MLGERLEPILGEYSERGFELAEIDDHTLQLSFQGKAIAIIGTLGLRNPRQLAETIQDSCGEHWELLKRAEHLARQTEDLSRDCQSRLMRLGSLLSHARG